MLLTEPKVAVFHNVPNETKLNFWNWNRHITNIDTVKICEYIFPCIDVFIVMRVKY